ncbi:MAG: sulfotransferase domain-containing protein [Acidimicrobiia bacterium]
MPYPDFLVIGAMKAGTTSLWQYLRSHASVFMPDSKEIHFFSRHWDEGLDWYHAQFDAAGAGQTVGEASTTYSMFPRYEGVAARIGEVLPQVKLIYVLRHPMERIRSHWRDDTAKGLERRPIDRAVLENPNYVDFTRYAMQIEQYMGHFDRHQMLIVGSDDLRNDRRRVLGDVFGFLGVADRTPPDVDREAHRTADKVVRRRWAQRLRRLPGYGAVASRAPQRLRRLSYRLTTRTGEGMSVERSVMSARTSGWVLAELADDLHRLGGYAPDVVESWRL